MNSMLNQEVVLACITSAGANHAVLRAAQRHARARGIRWCVVYLELWDDQKESRSHARRTVLEQLGLAERMGAVTFVTKAADYGRGFQEALAECARRLYSPVLVVAGGVNTVSTQSERRCVALLEEACTHRNIECIFIAPPGEPRKRLTWFERLHMRRLTLRAVGGAVFAVVLAFFANELLQAVFTIGVAPWQYTHSFLIYLIAIAVVAGRFGLLPGMIATVASFVAMKLFSVPPYYTLQVGSLDDMISLGLFLTVGAIMSLINSQVHAEAEASEINEWRMQALLQVYKIAMRARSRAEALAELHNNLHQFLHAEIAVYMPSLVAPASLQVVWPENPALTERDMEMLLRCWEELQAGNYMDAQNPETGWRFEPLSSGTGELGMLALRVPAAEATDTHFEQYVRMIAELVASILEKIESVDMKEESRVRDEREKLRTSLLSSVSHDLKTPLAAILGSLSVHRSMYEKLPETQRRELTDAALIEAQRLDSFITNIIDLAKIESGAVKFKRQWQSPEDLVQRVKKRMRMRFENHTLHVQALASTIEVELDPVISEQALLNVLDNAVKYTPSGSAIEIRMETADDYFRLHVRDHGPGIPDEEYERIFDKYTRLQRQDHQVAGTGLGLSLARAAMRGQGGDVAVAGHPGGGAVFTLSWPQWRVAAGGSGGVRLVKTA